MIKKEPFFRAAVSAALISFAGAAMAAGAPGQLAQTSPGAEPPATEAPPAAGETGAPPATGDTAPGAESGAAAGDLNVEEGMDVVNAEGEKIGEVSAIEGDQVIISVGGFLGMGARDVAIDKAELQMSADAQLQTSMTQEELEALPAYEEGQPATGGAESPPGGEQPEREGGAPPPTDGGGAQTTP